MTERVVTFEVVNRVGDVEVARRLTVPHDAADSWETRRLLERIGFYKDDPK